ncbi:MAG: hypothetical protein HDT23_04230, partial [Ruminococcus sp.]|nr:hypothetical protein [Ruminococcus sp.]
MSLTRKFLEELGIEPENIEKIVGKHTEVTTALKEQSDGFRTQLEELRG